MQPDYIPGATASLVLGLLSVILALVIGLIAPYIPLALGILGLVFAARAGHYGKSPVTTAGFVLSLVGLILAAVYLVIWLTCLGVTSSVTDTVMDQITERML